MADVHGHGIHWMLCLASKFMRGLLGSSWKFRQWKVDEQTSTNIEQVAFPEKEKEDAMMKPLDSMVANSFLSELRLSVLLLQLALSASVIYASSLNTPGGIWSANDGAVHLAGDPVPRVTNFRWYELRVINYFKATAFAVSLATVCLILHSGRRRHHSQLHTIQCGVDNINKETQGRKWFELDNDVDQHLHKFRMSSLLVLFAVLAASMAYQAGFWQTNATDGQYQHRDGDPILNIAYHPRVRGYLAFFYCSTTAFAASLVFVVLLLSNKFRTKKIKYCLLQAAMIGLIAAYATGCWRSTCSSRKFLQSKQVAEQNGNIEQEALPEKEKEDAMKPLSYQNIREADFPSELRFNVLLLATLSVSFTYLASLYLPGEIVSANGAADLTGDPVLRDADRRRYKIFFHFNATAILVAAMVVVGGLLLHSVSRSHRWLRTLHDAVLAAESGTLWTYGAVVAAIQTLQDGTLLEESTNATDGQYQHRRDGDPTLNTAYPRVRGRLNYCLLQAAMILDLIWLIGAYAAGSCREKKSAAPADDGVDDRNRAMKRSPLEATWHVASAAAHHMTGNRSLLLSRSYSPAAHDGEEYIFVHPATGEVRPLRVHGSGSVRTESIALDDVWYVPGLDANLVSTGQLARQGCAITLGPGGCRITRGDALLGSARFTEDNQFVLDYLKVVSSI